MSNEPDDIRNYDEDPRSPYFKEDGLEDAHTKKCLEIEADLASYDEKISQKLAGIFDENEDKYTDFINAIIRGYNELPEESADAIMMIEEIIGEIAMSEVMSNED